MAVVVQNTLAGPVPKTEAPENWSTPNKRLALQEREPKGKSVQQGVRN